MAGIIFFTFHYAVTASDINQHFPAKILSSNFLLRLLQSVSSAAVALILNFPATVCTSFSVPKPASDPSPASRTSPKFALENATDDVFTTVNAT